jgi:hypothetical protein
LPQIFDNRNAARDRANLIFEDKQQRAARVEQQQRTSPAAGQTRHQQGNQQAKRRV